MKDTFQLSLVGDSFITMRQNVYKEPRFKQMVDLIRDADIGFTNLEMTLHNYQGYPAAQSGGTYTRADPEIINDLKWMGVDLYSTANNHSLDYSYHGLFSTIETLQKAGVTYAGTGENLAEARSPSYRETSAGRIALIAATSSFDSWAVAGRQRRDMKGRPGINPLRYQKEYVVKKETINTLKNIAQQLQLPEIVQEKGEYHFLDNKFVKGEEPSVKTTVHKTDKDGNLKSIKEATGQADWTIFSLHAHAGKPSDRDKPAGYIPRFARACIDQGADIFVSHGHHALRGIEIYHNRPIFYSLGNFIFQNETVTKMPADFYEDLEMNPYEGRPDEAFDQRHTYYSEKQPGMPKEFDWFTEDIKYWRSVIAKPHFEKDTLQQVKLFPITLGMDKPRSQRGRPMLASKETREKILTKLQNLSQPFDTEIQIQEGVGIIQVQ